MQEEFIEYPMDQDNDDIEVGETGPPKEYEYLKDDREIPWCYLCNSLSEDEKINPHRSIIESCIQDFGRTSLELIVVSIEAYYKNKVCKDTPYSRVWTIQSIKDHITVHLVIPSNFYLQNARTMQTLANYAVDLSIIYDEEGKPTGVNHKNAEFALKALRGSNASMMLHEKSKK